MKAVETAETDILREIGEAFNRHDVDGVMAFFADDAVFETPKGPDPLGSRFARWRRREVDSRKVTLRNDA